MEKRRLIKVVKIRIADAKVGDVVNRDADSDEGWFEVASLDTLFNGSLQVADETTYITITGGTFDTIALQVATEVDLPTQHRTEQPASGASKMSEAPQQTHETHEAHESETSEAPEDSEVPEYVPLSKTAAPAAQAH